MSTPYSFSEFVAVSAAPVENDGKSLPDLAEAQADLSTLAYRASQHAHVASGGAGISLAASHNDAVRAHEHAIYRHGKALSYHSKRAELNRQFNNDAFKHHSAEAAKHASHIGSHHAVLDQVHAYNRKLGKGVLDNA